MSAEEHRKAESKENQTAGEHQARYNPSASAERSVGGPANRRGLSDGATRTYNPTAGHKNSAATHREHAAEHEAAAKELERFEEAECRDFASDTRAACPLMGQVAAVEDIAGGVRMRLAEDVPFASVLAHIRCHLAFARTRGYSGMADCPLYLKGVQAAPSKDGAFIDLTTDESANVEDLRKRMRAHVIQ